MAGKNQKNAKKVTRKSTKPASLRADRVFVVDTNVLLHDSRALFAFSGVVVCIPLVVLEELDTFKRDTGERGRNAREVIRDLDVLRKQGSLQEGVSLEPEVKGSILRVVATPPEEKFDLCSDSVDNQIIRIVQWFVHHGAHTTFITKDINARVKADALGLEAEDYTRGTITAETYYKGWLRHEIAATELRSLTERKMAAFMGKDVIFPNEFVIVENQNNPNNYRLFRYLGGSNYREISQSLAAWTFSARNVQQLMALDLLTDDSVQLVSLLGPAGTGKTFLTLVAGLFKVIKEHQYRKFLISRPIIALGADIGFLPGDVQEKLFHWMQPVYDNLEFIFSQMAGPDGGNRPLETARERRHRRRHEQREAERDRYGGGERRYYEDQSVRSDIDRLQQKGILSLEAITYMRGRSIPNQFVFIDEVQNLTPHEVKTIVSRAGEGSKVILAGDPFQIDSPYLDFTSNGLTVTSEKFKEQSIAGSVFLETSERSQLAKIAAEIL